MKTGSMRTGSMRMRISRNPERLWSNQSWRVLRWFRLLIRIPLGCLPVEVFWASPIWRNPRAHPEHAGGTTCSIQPENVLGSPKRT